MAETTTINNSMEIVKLSPSTTSATTITLCSNFASSSVNGTHTQPSKQLITSPLAQQQPQQQAAPSLAHILSSINASIAQANGKANAGKRPKSADDIWNATVAGSSLGANIAGPSNMVGLSKDATIDASMNSSEAGAAKNGGASSDLSTTKTNGNSISHCSDPDGCVTLADILKCFNSAVSEEQAWALIYQSVCLYRNALTTAATFAATNIDNNNLMDSGKHTMSPDTRLPSGPHNFNVHKDGSVHLSFNPRGEFEYFF
jgi:hypothetical protein